MKIATCWNCVEYFYAVTKTRSLPLLSLGFNCQRFMCNGQETLYFDETEALTIFHNQKSNVFVRDNNWYETLH